MTAPWMPRALDDTTASALEIVTEVTAFHPTAGSVPLDVASLVIDYDEARHPYITARGALAVTSDALEVLDERAPVRLDIAAGYVYPGRIRDVHALASLPLTVAVVKRGGGDRIEIDAACDDVALEAAPWTLPAAWGSDTTFATAVRSILAATAGQAAADAADIDPALVVRRFIDAGETMRIRPDDDLVGLLRDISDRCDARTFHDGLTGWKAVPADQAGDVVAAVTTGARGLARGTESRRDRAVWGNAQIVVYRWTDDAGTEHQTTGRAQILTGPHGVETVGRKTRPAIIRTVPASQAAADTAAARLLSRAVTRRRVVAVESARALWWIRPGDRITIATPDDPAQTVIVSGVAFDIPAGTMQIRTRTPEES